MRWALVLLAVTAAALTACADDDRLVVLTASSLTDVTEALVARAGVDAAVSAAGSQSLVGQVRRGAPADVLLVADPAIAEELAAEGEASAPVRVATTDLAIAVRPARAGQVRGPADLARPALRVVLADADVPLGRYTRDSYRDLEAHGLVPEGTLRGVLDGVDSLEDAARVVLTKVRLGEADAAVVFAANRRLAPDLSYVPWPRPVDVTYTAQILTGSPRTAAARALVDFVDGGRAAPIWERFGFAPTP